MTHTHTKTYAVVSNHMLRRTARRKKDKLDRLTKLAHGGRPVRMETLGDTNQRRAAEEKLRRLDLPLEGSYEERKAPRGPWRWQVIVWS
jgi:hypothetical protein